MIQKPIDLSVTMYTTPATEDEEKEEAHRQIWSEVFRIALEENVNYDVHEREIQEYWLFNKDKRKIFQPSDISRLQGRHEIDTLITLREITTAVKAFKNNTPGE